MDYHGTMEKYFAAKRLLFDGSVYPAPRVAVINAQDERGKQLAAAARRAGAEVRLYGIGAGEWRAAKYRLTPGGAATQFTSPGGRHSGFRCAGDRVPFRPIFALRGTNFMQERTS